VEILFQKVMFLRLFPTRFNFLFNPNKKMEMEKSYSEWNREGTNSITISLAFKTERVYWYRAIRDITSKNAERNLEAKKVLEFSR